MSSEAGTPRKLSLIPLLILIVGGLYLSYIIGYHRGRNDMACSLARKFRSEGMLTVKDVNQFCSGDIHAE